MTKLEELIALRKKVYNEILFNKEKLATLDDSTIDTINDLLGLIHLMADNPGLTADINLKGAEKLILGPCKFGSPS